MPLRIVCIANPISGRRNVDEIIADISARLSACGVRFERYTTGFAGHARTLAAQHADADAMLCCGGDGTICEIINGLDGRPVPLAILPSGTENILARELGCSADPDAVVRTLLKGNMVRFDVGRANGRRFLIVAGIGFDAEVVRRLVAVRRGHISYLSYARPLWDTLRRYGYPRLVVTVDGIPVFDDRGLVLIGNIPRYSIGLRILSCARPDDGRLDVCAFRCRNAAMLFQHATDVFWSRHVGRDGVFYAQGHRIDVTSPEGADVEIDGEFAGSLPLSCTIRPAEARILIDPLRQPS